VTEHLRIVRGSPTADELAAVTAVVSAASSTVDMPAEPPPTPGRWNDPAFAHRRHWTVGPGGWRAAR
jgi:hypothetical protein